VDPLLIAVVIACVHSITRLVDALAQWVVMRAWAGLVKAAAETPRGVQAAGRDRHGIPWRVQTRLGRGPGA
jgi:hypothetical protein